jgi:CRP-like cAMP-binding protein
MPADDRQRRLSRELVFTAFTRDQRGPQPWVLDRLATLFDERRVAAGDALYEIGDPADLLYFMSKGSVRVAREGSPTWTLEGRWVLGSSEVILERPRERTATALTDLELVTIPGDAWLELIEDSFELARMIVGNTARGMAGLYGRLGDAAFPAPAEAPSLPLPEGPLDLVERLLVVSEVALIREADVQTLTNLASAADELRFAPGEDVFRRGAPRDRMVVVADGLVEAWRDDPSVRGRFGPSDLVAGAAGLGDTTPSWRARALAPTRALSVPIELFLDELEEHFDVVRAAIAAMAAERERLLDAIVLRDPDAVFR